MSWASITTIGDSQGTQIVSTWWYEIPFVTADLTTARQDELLNQWETQVRAPLLAFHVTSYTLRKESCVFYDSNWVRTPYLPRERDLALAGTRAGSAGPPIVCAILSARVEPVTSAPRGTPTVVERYTPVRRGYWAFGPLLVSDQSGDGTVTAAARGSAAYTNLRDACASDILPAGWPTAGLAIRVSPEHERGNPKRGWGRIRSCLWRENLSTRYSRKRGVGV